jgi:hypothetical protein
MAGIKDVFEKITIDGDEINLQSLVSTNGSWGVGRQKNVEVEYTFTDVQKIPDYTFSNLSQLKWAYLPKTINYIGRYSFANSGLSYINDLSYITYIGDFAFAYTYLKNIQNIQPNKIVSNTAFSYINGLSDESKETLLTYYPNLDFGYMGYINNNSYNQNENSYNGNNGYDPWEDYIDPAIVNYSIGDKYRMPLMYTTRSGNIYTQRLGDIIFKITDIDTTVEHTDPFRIKFKVLDINVINPLTDRTIDYAHELIGRSFWAQDTFIIGDLSMFSSLPGFVDGVDGIDSFLTMKSSDLETYFPEMENSYGVTNYAIRKIRNDMSIYVVTSTQE